MKRNRKHKIRIMCLLAIFCLGILFTGCGADSKEKETEVEDAGQEITAADIKIPDSSSEQDITEEPGAENPTQENPVENTAQPEQPEAAADTASLYEQFLHNNLPAVVGRSFPQEDYRAPICEPNASYTLSELGARTADYFLDTTFTDRTTYDAIEYAYIGCPDNPGGDKKNLLVKFVGLDMYAPDDMSYAVFVLTETDGQLYITHEYECWARSAEEPYANGLLHSDGSGGAGDHFVGLSAILSDGSCTNIYFSEILHGWWTNYVDTDIYNEVFDENMEINLMVYIHTIGDTRYYQYDMSECTEEEKPLCETYIDKCRTQVGINWVTDDEIQAAIQNQCAALNIDYGLLQPYEETGWNQL